MMLASTQVWLLGLPKPKPPFLATKSTKRVLKPSSKWQISWLANTEKLCCRVAFIINQRRCVYAYGLYHTSNITFCIQVLPTSLIKVQYWFNNLKVLLLTRIIYSLHLIYITVQHKEHSLSKYRSSLTTKCHLNWIGIFFEVKVTVQLY